MSEKCIQRQLHDLFGNHLLSSVFECWTTCPSKTESQQFSGWLLTNRQLSIGRITRGLREDFVFIKVMRYTPLKRRQYPTENVEVSKPCEIKERRRAQVRAEIFSDFSRGRETLHFCFRWIRRS